MKQLKCTHTHLMCKIENSQTVSITEVIHNSHQVYCGSQVRVDRVEEEHIESQSNHLNDR